MHKFVSLHIIFPIRPYYSYEKENFPSGFSQTLQTGADSHSRYRVTFRILLFCSLPHWLSVGGSDFFLQRRCVPQPRISLWSLASGLWHRCGRIFPAAFFPGKKKRHPLTIFLTTALLGTGLELVIGWLLDTVWHLRYWDYRSCFLQYHGYICLWSAIGFGVAGVLWICIFSVLLEKFWFSLPRSFRMAFNTLCSLFFCVDCAAALIFPNIGRGITF